jgi:hypothetical protein
VAALAILCAALLGLAGCGSGRKSAPEELRLERADLIAVVRVLSSQQSAVSAEVAATKAAWPLFAGGLPRDAGTIPRPVLRSATERAASLELPALFSEQAARSLTGPASSLAGTYRAFSLLAARGWLMIGAAVEAVEHGSPAAARFARANVALYIESVYDAHFSLAQIGKQMPIDYARLGGAGAFGASLTPAEIGALADAYSEANDRLYPHERVKLGS